MREDGWYWVKRPGCEWELARWNGSWCGTDFYWATDAWFDEIDERRIMRGE